MTLQEVAAKLTEEGIFTGGPPELFESVGRLQLVTLLYEGLSPESRILDVGCGCLRAGYWLIRFLDPGCYFGIEPNQRMLDKGKEYLLNPELTRTKQPRFDTNDRFDFSPFATKFKENHGRDAAMNAKIRDSFITAANGSRRSAPSAACTSNSSTTGYSRASTG